MKKNIQLATLFICALGMSSCVVLENSTTDNLNYPAYSTYDSSIPYMQNSYDPSSYNYKYEAKKDVVVPDSYHVGSFHSPVSFQNREQAWVSSQDPQSYTIELAHGEKASHVAQALYKAPKNDRMAQIKSEHNGKEYYRGVYGSYKSAVEAQKALDSLPAEMKSGAAIKNWGSVQNQ